MHKLSFSLFPLPFPVFFFNLKFLWYVFLIVFYPLIACFRQASVALNVWQPEIIRGRQKQIVEQCVVPVESRFHVLQMELKLCKQQILGLEKAHVSPIIFLFMLIDISSTRMIGFTLAHVNT